MTETITADEVQPRDLIRLSRIARIDGDGGVYFPGTGQHIELLHRPSPKPPIGTVLTGKQLKGRQWKRGTKFCYIHRGDNYTARSGGLTPIPLYSVVELTRDGKFVWYSGDSSNIRLILDDSEFILVYRPEEESDKSRMSVSVDA